MPFGDRTGPLGLGAMTGRRAGYCAGYATPGYMNRFGQFGPFRSMHRGGGRGFGRGIGLNAQVPPYGVPSYNPGQIPPGYVVPDTAGDPDYEIVMLKKQAAYLEATLKDLKKQIGELEDGDTEKDE